MVCSAEICEALSDAQGIGWKSIGTRNLKDIGKVPLFVLRRAELDDAGPTSSRQRAERRRAERREARVSELAEEKQASSDEA